MQAVSEATSAKSLEINQSPLALFAFFIFMLPIIAEQNKTN